MCGLDVAIMTGKLASLEKIELSGVWISNDFVFMLINAVMTNKLPLLEVIEVGNVKYITPELQDLMNIIAQRQEAKHFAPSHQHK
jgi:hypothetical protein